jgi:Zn-dependent protease
MSGWGSTNPQYWVGPAPIRSAALSTSRTELLHLSIAYVVLTFDLAVVGGQLAFGGFGHVSGAAIASAGAFAAVAALTGFVAHEMAHKVSAQRYGFWAEFRMSPVGLFLSVVTALFGFLFAAPGATVIGGMGDTREWGRTSLAGPLLNLLEGGAFFGAAYATAVSFVNPTWEGFFLLLAFFNGWFATFNLIPLGPLDGRKVLRWSAPVWMVSLAVAATFTLLTYVAYFSGLGPF